MKRVLVVAALLLGVAVAPALAVVGGGEVPLKNKGGDVIFSHELHVEGMALACTECHDRLYTSSRQHKAVTMKKMQKGKSCGACHDGGKAFSVKGDCAKCHIK